MFYLSTLKNKLAQLKLINHSNSMWIKSGVQNGSNAASMKKSAESQCIHHFRRR